MITITEMEKLTTETEYILF